MDEQSVLYERTFSIPGRLVRFLNLNQVKQDQIVSIVSKHFNKPLDDKTGDLGYHTVYFYFTGEFQYELGTYFSPDFRHSVKGDRLSVYHDFDYLIFPNKLLNDISLDEFNKLIFDNVNTY